MSLEKEDAWGTLKQKNHSTALVTKYDLQQNIKLWWHNSLAEEIIKNVLHNIDSWVNGTR